MLTVLTVEDRVQERMSKFRKLLCANVLKVEEKNYRGIVIRYIRYINRKGKVNWDKISRKAGEGREKLIYCGDEAVPKDVGIDIFSPHEFRGRLCANMGLGILRIMERVPKSLRVGIYDPKGEVSDLAEHLLRFTDNLVVVTKNRKIYETQANRLMWDMGAVLRVSLRPSTLSTCGLIIAPCVLDVPFIPMSKSVVLTCAAPKVSLKCLVYHKYSLNLPQELSALCPDSIDTDIFAAGLYSLCRFYALGSAMPFACSSLNDTQTTEDLSKYFEDNFGT